MVLIDRHIIDKICDFVQFPSPYGDYGSYRIISKSNGRKTLWFPSPYGDYGSYLFRRRVCKLCAFSFSFRPLTGIMVLIRTPYKWLHSAIENAFCGADFLFSSFFTFLWKMIFKNRPIADF